MLMEYLLRQINQRTKSFFRIILLIILVISLLTSGIYGANHSLSDDVCSGKKIVTKISKQIEIPANSDYYLKFYSGNLTLIEQDIKPYSVGLSDKVKSAIAKSPTWIQRELARQFQSLSNPEKYADLILNSSKRYTDEIAFSIAYSSLDNVPPVDVIRDNVFFLYENDKWIQYADIVDYDEGHGNYYSTIRYKVLDNGTEKQFEYPKEIYYWYIVHPETAGEDAEYVYERFWRDYLFNHNDLGYPLLREKLESMEYLWDCKSYTQPENRLWKWSTENHPTAIEAVSYWIGKTIPASALGDRPGQPNIIAHEHNGWCGELQRIAVAAQRTSLIPSVGACNIGEDHVWREFYERGWHENDNWWTDSGGVVDDPDVYAYGWGKNMSSIFAWRGDDTIYEVTPRYIHPEDRIKVKFVVRDSRLQPVDGAKVTVLSDGLKDITWIKNPIWEKIEGMWDRLPELIKGKIIQSIYNKTKDRYDKIPDVINGPTTTIWNYTDINGECTFELGKNHNYFFIIQEGNFRGPLQFSKHNAIRILRNHQDKIFHVLFADISHKIQRHHNKEMNEGNCQFDISFDTKAYQLQKNVKTSDIGFGDTKGNIDFFILDEKNFKKYYKGRRFSCFNYIEGDGGNISFNAEKQDWYIVFRNHASRTNVVLDFTIQVKTFIDNGKVEIVSPDTTIFNNPVFNVGDTVNIGGIATGDVNLSICGDLIKIPANNCEWFYEWNTSGLMPGKYIVSVTCGDANDEILIELRDTIPPLLKIDNPSNQAIVEGNTIFISGHSWDNCGVEKVEVAVDNSEFIEANDTESWNILWNISELGLGDHTISVEVFDLIGQKSTHKISFVLNESGHDWTPQINSFYHESENLTNISNVVVYANVTQASPFDIKSVVLYYNNGTEIKSHKMYRYGNNPAQSRHEEDPLKNESNSPIFGFELGQFSTGTNITYWIEAYDTANNLIKSLEKYFVIE